MVRVGDLEIAKVVAAEAAGHTPTESCDFLSWVVQRPLLLESVARQEHLIIKTGQLVVTQLSAHISLAMAAAADMGLQLRVAVVVVVVV